MFEDIYEHIKDNETQEQSSYKVQFYYIGKPGIDITMLNNTIYEAIKDIDIEGLKPDGAIYVTEEII